MTGPASQQRRRRTAAPLSPAIARRHGGGIRARCRAVSRPLIALIQTFLVFFAQEMLETVVSQSARLVMTGQVQSAADVRRRHSSRTVCDQIVILFNCSGIMVDMQVASSWSFANTAMPTLTFDGNGQRHERWQFNPGNSGDIVVLRVMYVWPVMLGPLGFNLSNITNGNRLIMSSAAFQNEPGAT